MCLAVPAKVLEVNGPMGKVEIAGVTRAVSMMLLPEAEKGDYVLVHAGFAMQVVTEHDIEETNALLAEMNGAPRTVEAIPEMAADKTAAQGARP